MHVVVAGGGLAGLRTVELLRAGGFDGPVTMLAAESRPPYDRPPLSKAALAADGLAPEVLAGELDAAAIEAELDTTLSADFTALGVDLHLGEPATALDLAAARVRTDTGEYPYDRLVVVTGAVPIVLPGPGRQRFLRTHEDALELRDRLRPGVRLVIVGAGWIGAELATAAAARGCQVTVVEGGPAPLAAAIGAEVGGRTVPWYAAAGIELRTSVLVESVEDGGLALRGGGWIPADEVVTAVGVRPAVGWLAGSGLDLDNGVAVDPGLRTSAPNVFAAGDCASFESLRYGRRLRFEHWDIALHAPEVVAANVLGGDEVYDPVPYSWSEQFGRMMQYAGYHAAADRLIWRGPAPDRAAGAADAGSVGPGSAGSADAGAAETGSAGPGGAAPEPWTACWLAGDRLVALLAVDRPRDVSQGRRIMAAGTPVDPVRLADPAVQLKNATTS
jgi:3-phenylpropionate/trans-cinnamate dioxygenase ferredoxin reductase subunit